MTQIACSLHIAIVLDDPFGVQSSGIQAHIMKGVAKTTEPQAAEDPHPAPLKQKRKRERRDVDNHASHRKRGQKEVSVTERRSV